ncbi:ImmA/IrrE family metallo-endopeptidase [Lacticaseibacillus paracasei]|uniref:ImmA/IrrE family metallo-endopeptidase n=1 Tax=Lacticaseibacillus paracasei TaxID=1597 RepID=UPI002ADEBB79|nr:ImmA/IrrE family metallo-endopeptidase [Lacticaseibacillus paracasei]MEA0972209.1 ImmA/IrrE family metallo-endopeptidase [Lacticaseibacillus paracasei]
MSDDISDIFDAGVVKFINSKAPNIVPNDFIKEYEVDVEKLAKLLGYQVQFEDLPYSGELHEDTIIVNKKNVPTRQRFTIAHELGHAAEHQSEAKRRGGIGRYGLQERFDEITANKFASELLMPVKLVIRSLLKSADDNGYNSQRLTSGEVAQMETGASSMLNVSTEALKYRVENLGIFRKQSDERIH